MPKSEFPALFKSAINSLQGSLEINIKSGFRGCGIVPLDPEVVLKKLPDTNPMNLGENHWSDTLKDFLKASRWADIDSKNGTGDRKRGKKLNVKPGKGVCYKDLVEEKNSSIEDTSDESTVEELNNEDTTEKGNDNIDDLNAGPSHEQGEETETHEPELCQTKDIDIGTFLLIKLTNAKHDNHKLYVGCVTQTIDKTEQLYLVNFLRKQSSPKMGGYFTYPAVKDESIVEKNQIVQILSSYVDLRRQRYQFSFIKPNVRVE